MELLRDYSMCYAEHEGSDLTVRSRSWRWAKSVYIKHIPSTHLAQQNTLSRIIEKARIVERDAPSAPEQATQNKMLHKCRTTTGQSDRQSRNGRICQPPKEGMEYPELL